MRAVYPITLALGLVLVSLFAVPAQAEWFPSFDVGSSSQLATHIVVVDAKGTVLESWRGDLKKGEKVPFPAGETPIKVSYDIDYPAVDLPGVKDVQEVTGKRRVLFLTQSKDRKTWTPASLNLPNIHVATVWIEDDKAFAVFQIRNPGDTSKMHPLYMNTAQLKKQIEDASKVRAEKPRAKSAANEELDLSGPWRLLLPEGYEYEVTFTKGQQGTYRWVHDGLTFQGEYRLKDGELVSVEMPDRAGQFVWKVNTRYMLTLTGQTVSTGSKYPGAVLFRKRVLPVREDEMK